MNGSRWNRKREGWYWRIEGWKYKWGRWSKRGSQKGSKY